MGLDNYFERTEGTGSQEISFPDGLRLCGGMLSGHGSDGSFRGKVYTEFFRENVGVDLYSNFNPGQVAEVTMRLAEIVKTHAGQAWGEEGWQEDAPSEKLGYYGVTAQEVRDLMSLFNAASEQRLQLVASY